MPRSRLFCFVLILWGLLLMCGCAEGESAPAPTPTPTPAPAPTPMVLTVCAGTEGSTLDPTYLTEPDPPDYLSHLFEGLMKYAPAGETDGVGTARLTYGLAESVEVSEDGLTYRFTLRPDARWSDGQPITSADFVYGWQRLLTPAHSGETAHAVGAEQLLGVLKGAREVASGDAPGDTLGVRGEGERVLVAELEQPCPWFVKLCAMPCMVPLRRDVIEAYGGDWTHEEHLVVSGAYTISEWVHDDYMRLAPNPHYYAAEALGPDAIVWRFGAEGSAGSDFAAGVSDGAATGTVDVAGTYYLYLNANAIRDWRVRAAMLLSIDRESLAAALGAGARPAAGLVPAGISLTDGSGHGAEPAAMYAWAAAMYPEADLESYEGRCVLARQLMEQARRAGTWHGGYTVYYRFNGSTVNRLVAERCQNDWQRELELRAEFVPMEAEDYTARLRTNTFDVAYLRWLPDYDDPQSFLRIMERGGAYNHSGWGDVRYNEQLQLAAVCMDPLARNALLRRAEEMLFEAERFAVCPLYWFGENYYAAAGVTGVGHSPVAGYVFSYVEIA